MAKKSKHWRMPSPTKKNIQEVLDAVRALRGENRRRAKAFAERVGPRGLFDILHGMRRWYMDASAAWKVIPHREALAEAMDFRLPVGAFRGYHLPRNSDDVPDVGDRISLKVTRNGGCSSWTMDRKKANAFSGASRRSLGIVVKLLGADNAKVFIAPPHKTKAWFNALYEQAMGRSFRFKEKEYAICGSPIRVVS